MTESSALGIFVLRPTGREEPVLLLPGDSIVVGRSEDVEVPLFHDSISRASGNKKLTPSSCRTLSAAS